MLLGMLYQKEPGRTVRSTEKQIFHLISDNPARSEGKSKLPLAMPKATVSPLNILGASGADKAWQSGERAQSWHRGTGWSQPCLHPLG